MTTKTETKAPATSDSKVATIPTKHLQVVELLLRDEGASLKEMSILANWLDHSTRALLTKLKKKDYEVTSCKTNGVRRYQIAKAT